MNYLSLSIIAAAALAAPAAAQDAPAAPATVRDGGFYAGVHLGYGFSKPGYTEPCCSGNYDRNPDLQGVAGGLIAGYNFPTMRGVKLGVEGDIGLLNADAGADRDADYNDYSAFDMKWNAHLRGRVGVDVGGATLFGAAGLAVARLETNDVDEDWGSFDRTYTGWTLGAGVEKAVTDRLSLRLEYLHDEFGRKRGEQRYSGGESSYDVRVKPDSDLARFAVTYGF